MMFTRCSILNPQSPDIDENRSPFAIDRTERMELHLDREQLLGLSTDLHKDLKTVSRHLLSWPTV